MTVLILDEISLTADSHEQCKDWLAGFQHTAQSQQGFVTIECTRSDNTRLQYLLISRFSDAVSQQQWQTSVHYQALIQSAKQLGLGHQTQALLSMDTQHASISRAKASVSKHLIALITFIALIPLVYFIPPLVSQTISAPPLMLVVISVAIIVPVISYLILPFTLNNISKLLAG